jgi:hypothetical protein
VFELRDLLNPRSVTPRVEGRRKPHLDDLVSQWGREDPGAQREHVRVIVAAGEPGREEVQAQRRANAGDFVRGDLFPLAAAADHDSAIHLPGHDRSTDGRTDPRVVDRSVAVGSEVANLVAKSLQRPLQVLFETIPRVIRTDGDAHARIVL